MVTVYTKPNCRPCLQTKKALAKKNVSYTEVDLSENPDVLQKFIDAGYKSAPIVETSESTWCGFKPENIKQLNG